MRKLLMICAAASVFMACNNQKDIETSKDVITTDTTGLYKSNVSTDTGTAVVPMQQPAVAPLPQVIRETRTVYVDRKPKSTTQKNVPTPTNQSQTQSNTGRVPLPTSQSQTQSNAGVPLPTGSGATGTTTSTGTGATVPATTPQPEEKKGMSNSTKGAVIGGAGGAVAGAILSKKKGTGAIIGGVLGAAGGYILGKKKDKKAAQDTIK